MQIFLEETLKVLPNVDVDLLALPQVLDLLLQNHCLHLVLLERLHGALLAKSRGLGLTSFNLWRLQTFWVALARSSLAGHCRLWFPIESLACALPKVASAKQRALVALRAWSTAYGVLIGHDALLSLVLLKAIEQVYHVNELLELLHLLLVRRRLRLLLCPGLSLGFVVVFFILVGANICWIYCLIWVLMVIGAPLCHLLAVDDVHLSGLTGRRGRRVRKENVVAVDHGSCLAKQAAHN